VIVVAAAGNAGVNLDAEQFLGDSGAIVVGACSAGAPHSRSPGTNFGNRIDCHAWDDGVHTTGAGTTRFGPTDFEISGTSSAAAIIAGVCLLIQHLQRLNGGAPLSPIAVRDILRRTENGTETAAPFVDRIGVMPDLQKIIANQGF
jgi:serine protease